MANYETLKAAIQQVVKTNGNNEITGALLQQSLLAMVNSLGSGYQFIDVATPDTKPGTPDQKVFYIANGKGTYSNFDGISITEDEVVILYYDTDWHKVSTGIASQAKLTELNIGVNELNEEINGCEPDIDISSLLQEKCQYWNAQLNAIGQPSSAFVGYEVDIKPYAYVGKKVKFKTYYNSYVPAYCGFVLADGSTSGIMQSDQGKVVEELERPANASKFRLTWSKELGSAYCHVISEKSIGIKEHIEAIETDLQDTQNSISGVLTSVDNINAKINGKHEEAVDLSNDAEAKCNYWDGNLSPIGVASANINGFEVNVEQYVGRTIQFKTYYNLSINCYCGFVLADGTTANIMQSDQWKVVQELEIPSNAKYFRFSWFKNLGATYCSIKENDIEGFDERLNELDKLPAIVGGLVAESESQKLLSQKVLVIGDSISTDELSQKYFSDNRNIYPEYAEYNSYGYYNKWVYDLVAQGLFKKENVVNNSIHATGYVAHLSTYDNDFVTRIKKMADANTYDLVIVFGGINDCLQNIPLGESGGDVDTYFKPAVDEFYSYLVNNFTQARICVLLPLKNKNFFSRYNDYVDYIRSVVEGYSLPVLDLNKQSGFCPSNETFCRMWTFHGQNEEYPNGDGLHPNKEYQEKFLAKQIKRFIQGLL